LSRIVSGLTHKLQPDRGKINLHDVHELHCWVKHLKVTREDLQKAIEKVGNSAAAVRKELAV
jgi:predicted RNA-binding protein YlqC (UPF0109 family)